MAEFTGSAEILDGRVKTLHPRLHAALLARRDNPDHMATLEAESIEPIDLVCVNLYPFERTVAQLDVSEDEAVENIDVGGPTMIRAAAKNHDGVAVVVAPRGLRRGARGAERVRGRDLAGDAPLARLGGVRAHGRLRRGDLALVRDALRGVPEPLGDAAREVHGPPLRREPAPEGGALHRARRPDARALRDREAARPAALLQQPARPRLRAAAAGRVRRARLRDRQAQQPLRGGDRRDRRRRRTSAPSPATRCRPSAA